MASSYQQRIERGMARYLAAHPGASQAEAKRAARGHGSTGEHGVTAVPLGQNKIAYVVHDAQFVEKAARRAESEAGEGGRVKIVLTDREGNRREILTNKGHASGITAEELRTRIASDGAASVIDAALKGRYVDRYGVAHEIPLGGFDPSNIVEYQLILQ